MKLNRKKEKDMVSRCPGQDNRNLRLKYINASPAALREIFSDELRIKMPEIGNYVYREKTPSCIEWCASARQCLGEERWKALHPENDEKDSGGLEMTDRIARKIVKIV